MRDALPVALIGMNADLMVQYIQLIADRLLASIGHPILYRATLPTQLSFMDQMSLPGKNNFFEKRVSEYAKAGIGASALDQEIRFDETF
jgi:ribonucleotide reductase beta subunit family protein with ferritin-like domain